VHIDGLEQYEYVFIYIHTLYIIRNIKYKQTEIEIKMATQIKSQLVLQSSP